MTDDYTLGHCQSCGMQFRILDDGTVRTHAIGGGVRCDGSRLLPASTYNPVMDPPEARPADQDAVPAPWQI